MKYTLLCILVAVGQSHAYTPAPIISTHTPASVYNANFMDLAGEIKRQSIKDGGTVNLNVSFSSSVNVLGSLTVNGNPVSTNTASPVSSVSSFTYVPETVITNQTFTTCVASVTLTVPASTRLYAKVFGSMVNNSTQDSCWTVLTDGIHSTSNGVALNNTLGMFCHWANAANDCFNANGTYIIDAPSAGSHTFCLAMATTSGTNLKFLGGTTNCASGIKLKTIFGVESNP